MTPRIVLGAVSFVTAAVLAQFAGWLLSLGLGAVLAVGS